MPTLGQNLELSRCPHCTVATPLLSRVHTLETTDHRDRMARLWVVYVCSRCGGLVTGFSYGDREAIGIFPTLYEVDNDIPARPRAFLQQAAETMHAASGSVMLSASAVDAMLKLKGLDSGSLYARIEQAVRDGLLTTEMGAWAHKVRLDANDQRHADEQAPLPSETDARHILDFATALAQFLFVLPARITHGINAADAGTGG